MLHVKPILNIEGLTNFSHLLIRKNSLIDKNNLSLSRKLLLKINIEIFDL